MKKTFSAALLASIMLVHNAFATELPKEATLEVKFELPELEVAMYARPYVAIWVEDDSGNVVKNIALWTGNQTEWLKDIRSWWRKFGRYNSDQIDGISSATRAAGNYTVHWDGTTESGTRALQGNYTLFTEVVREHGGRDIVRQPITLTDTDFVVTTEPKAEIGVIQIQYSSN